ncbi:MAG: nitrite/sulfite reductase [Solirubrobacterales bacterium]
MRDATPADRIPADGTQTAEPLVRMADLAEYRRGLDRHLAGEWDDERWTAYRVRFGVYGQKQPGVQMVRIKIPGGVLPVTWLKAISDANRAFAVGDAHITTRQDIQIYSVPLARTAELLEALYSSGITTREACGNTLRNMTSCSLAGACPRELVDAGRVAEQLALSWIRHPLVQHMPRKVKVAISGCATDCGTTAIHDLGFIAVERDGRPGFRVVAGGGLGAQPRTAVTVLDFVGEEDLPVAVEALARIHQRYSDRRNRNAARIKYVLKRFGEEKFVAVFREEFARLKGLGQRPWASLDWRKPSEAAIARTPVGVVAAHDGSSSVVVAVPLGILSSDQLDRLHEIALAAGVSELRTTRDQNLVFVGVAPADVAAVVAGVRAIGLEVPASPDDVPDVISCPGTTTCRIGITNSQNFARQVVTEADADPAARGTSVHVSGCQNSCGLHHVADFGLHGMAKKVDGRSAPHYQLHIGGDKRSGAIGLTGPVIPARLANEAIGLLRQAYRAGAQGGEGVRGWAERLGKDGLAALLAPLDGKDVDGWFVDWGEAADFPGAPQARGECAAPFAADELLADLADDALIELDRNAGAGRWVEALQAAERATVLAARRLLQTKGLGGEDDQPAEAVYASLRTLGAAEVSEALEGVLAERAGALGTGEIGEYREAVAWFIDTVREKIERPAAAPATAAIGNLDAILGAGE